MALLQRSLRQRAVKFSAEDEVDARQVTVIATDATQDLMGDIVEPGGARLENFRRNPVILWSHDATQPIARCSSITQMLDRIVATIQFPQPGISAKSDEVLGLIRAGVLSAVSIGFLPEKWNYLDGPGGGVQFLEWTLTEISVCSIPANPSALVTERSIQHRSLRRGAAREEHDDGNDPAAIAARRQLAETIASVKAGWERPPAWRIEGTRALDEQVSRINAAVAQRDRDEARAPQLQLAHLRAARRAAW